MNSQTISLIMIEWSFDFHPLTDYKFGYYCLLTFPNPCQVHGVFCFNFIVSFINWKKFNCLIGIQITASHFLHQTGNYFFQFTRIICDEMQFVSSRFSPSISYSCPSFINVILSCQNTCYIPRIQENRPRIKAGHWYLVPGLLGLRLSKISHSGLDNWM